MANNSIKARFRNLYKEVEANLTDESKIKLIELSKLNQGALHDYRNNLLNILQEEYSKIINSLALEYGLPIDDIEYEMLGNLWDNYFIAIEKLKEPIHKFATEEELNKKYEEVMAPYLNQSDEENEYWRQLRIAINSADENYDEDNYDDDYDEPYIEESEKEKIKLTKIEEIETTLQIKMTDIIKEVENRLGITGQVIDFFLYLYDMGKQMIFGF